MKECDVGMLAFSQEFPGKTVPVGDIFSRERANYSSSAAQELGIDQVHYCTSETGSSLAVKAARNVLDSSGVAPGAIDIIVDYSILPQEYLVPAWNMSNKVQHEIGSKKSFTIGFSGAGGTNILVALDFACATLRSDESVEYILLIGADVAIPGNRLLNREEPLTILGDGASALLVGRKAERNRILATRLASRGSYHDVCYIPGGGMQNPTRDDLYRMEIVSAKYHDPQKYETLSRQAREVLEEAGLNTSDIRHVISPNISADDRRRTAIALGMPNDRFSQSSLPYRGHVQANDLVFNLIGLLRSGSLSPGDPFLLCSHGMGFTSGVVLCEH